MSNFVLAVILIFNMTYSFHRLIDIKHSARAVLVLFVISVLNMMFQMPVHAAMQQSMSMGSQGMEHSMSPNQAMTQNEQGTNLAMSECVCPPTICESVEAQNDHYASSTIATVSFEFDQYFPTLIIVQKDLLTNFSNQYLENTNKLYRQATPPPIQFTTELQI